MKAAVAETHSGLLFSGISLEQKDFNWPLFYAALALVSVGLVAMSSASIEFAAAKYGDPFFNTYRYAFHLALAIFCGFVAYQFPMVFWQKTGWFWLLTAFALLVAVLLVGREVNGSRRWLALGPLTLQCSELAKLFVIVYLAGYLVRRQDEVRAYWTGFIKPMAVLFFVTLLLMKEPDFGATVVTLGTAFGMIFLAGVRLWQFLLVIFAALFALVVLVVIEPYRMQRWTVFTDPWADQYGAGYQLIQSLIAFGRGEWFGVGLGNSIQKLFYLPESHTDFVFAIYAEEFGFIGVLALLTLYGFLITRMLLVARRAESLGKTFSAYVVYGIALMLSGQIFINIGVNLGLLPTKGLTLPFLSYGGSSLIVCCVAVAMVLRIHAENLIVASGGAKKKSAKKQRAKRRGGER